MKVLIYLEDKSDLRIYPVKNPTFGIYTLKHLQLHFSTFQHLIRFLEIGRLCDLFSRQVMDSTPEDMFILFTVERHRLALNCSYYFAG